LWLIAHETRMQGRVLNGSPVTISRIAGELGESFSTAKRNLNRLSREGYVLRKRNGLGKVYSYSIAHSKKWRIRFESGGKNDLTGGGVFDLTQAPGQGRNDPRVGSEMPPSQVKNGPSNKEDRELDKLDNRNTTCNKCGGTGMYVRLIPSELIPGTEKEDWVKCDECQ